MEELIVFCKNCGESLNENQAICLKCGVEVGKGKSFCANCGKPVGENAAVCLSCGAKVEDEKTVAGGLNGQDKMTMVLVCLFLGGLGIHNFMMGETKKGILKIVLSLCCGIGGILALIDLVKILTDKYVATPN
ncbi:MAG: NINE protein [Clostridia bacterium]|nr:NINE protein [Clostridia bacterium]